MSNSTKRTIERTAGELVDFETMDRSAFLLKGALATGALYGAAAVGPMIRDAFAQGGDSDQTSKGDIEIVKFALLLEYLEADFYKQVTEQVDLSSETGSLFEEIGANEQEHVDFLKQALKDKNEKPGKKPSFTFPLTGEAGVLELSVMFEDTGVSAYNGAGPKLESKQLLASAGSIVQVEARHAAAVRMLNGEPSTPDAFDITLEKDEVLVAVDKFIDS